MRLAASPGVIRLDWQEGTSVLFSPTDTRTHLVHAFAAELIEEIARHPGGVDADDLDVQTETLEALINVGLLRWLA